MDDPDLVDAVLDDWRTAPVPGPLRAMLAFLEKLTVEPDAITAADITPLREAGLSDAAIEDAIHVTALFNIYDRMADTLDFDIPDPDVFARGAAMLLRRGYA
jgi:uncharacterized peroxidase-related enzyme